MATVTNSIPHPMLCVPRQNAHALRTLGKRPTSTDRCLSIRRTNTRHALSCLSIRIGIQQIVVSSQSWFLASLACRLTIHSSRPPSASAEFVALERIVMGTFVSSACTLRTVQPVSALVSLTGGWMPQPGHPIPSAALRGASYSMPMFMRSFPDQQRLTRRSFGRA